MPSARARAGAVGCQDGHWPPQPWPTAGRQIVGDIASAAAEWLRPSRPAGAAAIPHVAGLCEAGVVCDLPSPPPSLTAIVLNRQGADLLETLFSSFQKINTYPDVDFILVDHGSADASLAVAAKWAKRLPLTIVRCAQNHSFAFSCNRAAERARGEYLLLLNNDIVWVEDILGRLIATAARHRGMVGCKLMTPTKKPGRALAVQHIGVRFGWSERRRVARPYEAVPEPGDARIAAAPSRFLAVTAALCVCRRDDYLATGGMCEGYVYGFEDVDLDLKFALGFGRVNISLNDATAFHAGGATRTTRISKARRQSWLTNNFAVLNRRFGYAVRRTILPLLFADDGSLWGRRANLALIACGRQSLHPLGEALRRKYGWNVLIDRRHDLRALDLLLVGDPAYRLDRARHRHPMLHRVAWVLSDGSARMWRELAVYDLVLAADATLAATVAARREGAVSILDPSAPDAAEAFFAILLDYLIRGYRFSIKKAGDSDGLAGPLATALRLAGHHVRVDRPARWHCADGIRDDVAILLPGDPACPPIPDKIALACGDAAPQAAVDARLPLGDAASLAAAILAAVATLHPVRLRGPIDQALVPRPPFAERIVAGWDLR
jgi:GT2 family glycosyltransferase